MDICHGCHFFFVYVQPLNDGEVCFKQPWIESQLGRCWVNKTWSPILGCSGLLLTGQSRFEVGEMWFELITPVFDTYDVCKYLLNIWHIMCMIYVYVYAFSIYTLNTIYLFMLMHLNFLYIYHTYMNMMWHMYVCVCLCIGICISSLCVILP